MSLPRPTNVSAERAWWLAAQRAMLVTLVFTTCMTSSAWADTPDNHTPASASLARDELWLSVSATLLTAGLAGSFALKVAALHDRARALPEDSQERPSLERDAIGARRYAVGFGVVASLFALTSTLLLLYQPATDLPEKAQWTPMLGTDRLGLLCRGRF